MAGVAPAGRTSPRAGARGRARLAGTALLAATLSAAVPAAPQVGVATGPVSALPPARVEALEVVVSNAMSRMGIPGLSVAVAHEGALVFANGYGFADLENFVSARADTAYRLASVSKPMTAVAVLQLAEEGTLDLDAPVQESCPAFPEKRWPVTSRQLLRHEGGVRHYRDGEVPLTRRFSGLDEGLTLFKDDPLEYEPGTASGYSTYGYNLLGCVAEGVRGRPFPEILDEAVFEPAGMTRTRTDNVQDLIPNRARGYVRDEAGALRNAALADMSYKVPGGGLSGTAPDVARFGLALAAGGLVSEDTLAAMLVPRPTDGSETDGYGLGLNVGRHQGDLEAWHLGGQEGVSTALYLRPVEGGPVVAILTNLQFLGATLLPAARQIADLVAAAPDDAP